MMESPAERQQRFARLYMKQHKMSGSEVRRKNMEATCAVTQL